MRGVECQSWIQTGDRPNQSEIQKQKKHFVTGSFRDTQHSLISIVVYENPGYRSRTCNNRFGIIEK